mgnify:CR=1 FL=1
MLALSSKATTFSLSNRTTNRGGIKTNFPWAPNLLRDPPPCQFERQSRLRQGIEAGVRAQFCKLVENIFQIYQPFFNICLFFFHIYALKYFMPHRYLKFLYNRTQQGNFALASPFFLATQLSKGRFSYFHKRGGRILGGVQAVKNAILNCPRRA